jgi:hypothetical protein
MKVIFLDVDGVLNQDPDGDHQIINPKNVQVLNWLIERSKAFIVLSSAWRHVLDLEEFKQEMRAQGFKFPERIVDATPFGGARGDEIRNYLDMDDERTRLGGKKVSSFVILDDNEDMADQRDRLVQTNPQTGLTMADAQRALELLQMG